MQAEAAIVRIMTFLGSAVKARYEQYPLAPRLRHIEVSIDEDVTIEIPGEPPALFADFHAEQLSHEGFLEAIADAADSLKAAIPAGGFPFRIGFEVELFTGRDGASMRTGDVRLNAAGIGLERHVDWRTPLERLQEKLELLHAQEPESMEKQAYYVIREYPGDEGIAPPHKIFASSPAAARNKALMIQAPWMAKAIFSGQAGSLSEADRHGLSHLHVAPAGLSLSDMLKQPEDAPSPA